MKFAIVNGNGKVEVIYQDHMSAMQEYEELAEPGDGWSVKPIMTFGEWSSQPKDYRGFLNGRPAILYLNSVHGYTVYGYVYLIESWNEVQLDINIHKTYAQLVEPAWDSAIK